MNDMILAVAGPEWHAALSDAAKAGAPPACMLDAQAPADAVISLATRPNAYQAVAVEEAAAGPWFDTLLDLTLGDTDRPIPLLLLGHAIPQNRLNGTPVLNRPLDPDDLRHGLKLAAINAAQHVAPQLPETFSDADSIRIRYQPIVQLAKLRATAIEILARVELESGALVGPQAILAAMTNGDYAMSLSRMIVDRTLREREERHFDKLGLSFAFNLPLDAMLHPSLLNTLDNLRREQKIPPSSLRFELTETQPVTDLPSIATVIHNLRDAGYRVALDDITPFTPNLDALLELPFIAVKLDRFVVTGTLSTHAATAKRNRNFIEKITAHAKPMGRAVIAEGIESETTRQLMLSLGATHGQGYLFARPLPANAVRPWLTHWRMGLKGK
jgi:EAL domain-containing protein (putative c-di-GMP-specific phosphodiesterase class I)